MKNLIKKYPMLGSSVDPESLSLTVKSLGIALIPVILALCRLFDLSLVENDIIQVINALATVISMIGVVWGVYRKVKK